MKKPSEKVFEVARIMDGVESGEEDRRIPEDAKEKGIVVVYGASDDLVEFRGAIDDEADGPGEVYLVDGALLDESRFDCGCEWAERAKAEFTARSKTIEALWCEEEEFSWTYRTEIPHATFTVFEDGEKYCRGIVFSLGDIQENQQ